MIRACVFSAAVAFAAWAGLATAGAGPLAPELPAPPAIVVPAGGCHADVQTHYVPEVAGTLPHYHAGGNCRPIAAQGQPGAAQDCHTDVRRHFLPGYGEVYHRHRSRSCQVVLAEDPRATDCHEDVRLHFVPGRGEIYHSHRGRSCQVVEYEPRPGAPRAGCITIGPVTVCP